MKINRISVGLLLVAAIIFGVGTASAQSGGAPLEPGLTDGVWEVLVTHGGPVNIETATATTFVSGGGTLTVIEGAVSGKYSVSGTELLVSDFGSGTGTMTSSGEWTGTATKPAMADGQTSIEGVITTESGSQNISFTFPPTDRVTIIPIINATCTIVIGDWPYVANNAFAEVGVSSSISGSFVAVRQGDVIIEDKPLSYFEKANSLALAGAEFLGGVFAGIPVDYGRLDTLLSSAEQQYALLQRQADCGVGDAKDYVSFITGTVQALLEYALEHPKDFSDMHLLRIVNAAARVGVIGTGGPSTDGTVELGDRLALEIKTRETRVIEEKDCSGGMALLSVAAILGNGTIAVQLAGTVGEVC